VPKVLGIAASPREKGGHNLFPSLSTVMLQGVLERVKDLSGFETEILHLSRLRINPCRGCFSDVETRCHFLCDCHDDDFPLAARKMVESDGVLLATPTYMFSVSSVLKRFMERWISFKAPAVPRHRATKSLDECFELMAELTEGESAAGNPLQGKVGGVLVAGSELGQDNVVRELMLVMSLYGFILPPQCFLYHTGHTMQSMEEVREGFYKNQWLLEGTENLARSLVQMIRLTRGAEWPEMAKVLVRE